MRSVSRGPRHRALIGVVSSFWVSVRDVAGEDELVLPSGRAQLVVRGDHGGSLLVGPRTRPAVVRPSGFAAGMSLGGTALPALSSLPPRELLDEAVDAADVWTDGRWAECLEPTDADEILDRLEFETLRHLRGDTERNQLVETAERALCSGARIDEVASSVGADRRRLVPAFRDEVGVGPKRYQRILRFQRAVRAMRSDSPAPLAAIATRCGYADQAHMNRDFKEFSGLTPGRMHGATSRAHNHVPIRP